MSNSLETILFSELYYSRQPLLFAIFFFTIHFTFRKTKLLLVLIACQLCFSALLYNILLNTKTEHLYKLRNDPINYSSKNKNEHYMGTFFNQNQKQKRKRFSGEDIENVLSDIEDVRAELPKIVWYNLEDNLTKKNNNNYTCHVYRNTPLFGNRYIFALPDERQQMLRYIEKESMYHTHYIICTFFSGKDTNRIIGMNKYYYNNNNNRKRNYVAEVSSLNQITKPKKEEKGKKSRVKIKDVLSTFTVSAMFIVFLQSVYSIFGIITSYLICRMFDIPRFYRSFSFTKDYKWINYFLELGLLFCSFLYVDEYIAETRFPIGIYRTFIIFTKIAIFLYYLNRTEENVKKSWSNRREMYNYDRCYLHWLFCSLFLISFHFVCFTHGYCLTFISLIFLVSLYTLIYLFSMYEEKRVKMYSRHQYFWHRLSDTCTRIESSLFF